MSNFPLQALTPRGSRSPPQITPARANTPTSAPRSSGQTRPPLVGQSLATSLARISSSRPNTRDSTRDKSLSPDRRKTPPRITGLFPDNPPPSLAGSFRQPQEVRHIADLDVLKELQASLHNQLAKSRVPMEIKSKRVSSKGSSEGVSRTMSFKSEKKVVGPIGASTDSKMDIKPSVASESLDGRRGISKIEVIGGNRPLHHSLPSRLTTPKAAPLPTSSSLRKNSRVVLSPLDPSRKVSAP